MSSRNRLFGNAPEGTAVLFFISIFATLGFAVLYSTLVLYATKHLQLSLQVIGCGCIADTRRVCSPALTN